MVAARHAGNKRAFSVVLSGWVSLVALLSLFPTMLRGQMGQSGITGTVTDPAGAVVPGAQITAMNESTNVETSTISSAAGTYVFQNLIPGPYTVTVTASGFQKSVVEHVRTEVDMVSTVDIKLRVGALAQQVTVTAAPAVRLNTESGTVAQLVSTKEIENLPLNGRSWVSLNYLTPGAVGFHGTTAGESVMASVTPTNVVLNGLRGGNNEYFIDASYTQSRETQVILIIPPLDALTEFRVQTGNYTAEYSAGAAGVISAVTKNGTNQFQGSAWEYLRNDVFDARNFFTPGNLPPLRRNQFGGVLGGPIRKDRTFFFGGYEGFRQREGQTLVGDYPTQAMRNGDLSSVAKQLTNPLTGQPFPNNQIPVNPLSARWLNDWIPLPNTNVPVGQGNLRIAEPAPINYNTFVVRIDHTLSDKTSLFGRYYFTRSNSDTPWYIPGFLRPVQNHGQNVSFQVVRSFTPTTAGQFRFAWNRPWQDESTNNSKGANMLDELGVVPGAYNFETKPDPLKAPPQVSVTGFSPFGSRLFGRPRKFYGNSYFYDVLFFLNRGSHNMKFGGGVHREFFNFPEDINPTGGWSYTGAFSGYGFSDFLLAYPRSVSTLPGLFHQDNWTWQHSLWFQDDWKATRKLTLNLGLRWDYDGRWISSSGTVANWDLSKAPTAVEVFPKTIAENCPAGGCSPLSPYAPNTVDGASLNWAPRIGFAYRVLENTVVRGGYGVYWQTFNADPFLNICLNPPFVVSAGATYQLSDLPTFNRTNPLLGTTATGIGVFALDTHIKDGYVQEWNLSVERIIAGTLVSMAYVGNTGTHLYSFSNPNLAPPGPGPINPRRPYTNVAGISWEESCCNSNYNALQMRAERRVGKGLSFIVAYAWGHAIDDSSGTYIEGISDPAQQPRNRRAERSNSEYDVRQALTFSYIYQLPFGRGQRFLNGISGVADKFIGGWQFQGITRMLTGDHETNVGLSWDNLNDGGSGYADEVCDPNLGRGRSSGQKVSMFFNTACFAAPGGGTVGVPNYVFGNAARHPLDSPGIYNWDMGLEKVFAITERLRLRFSAEFFNAFNHPNFSPPNTTFGTPQFGTLTSAADGREIQFGLKLLF